MVGQPSKISVVWNGVDPETYNPANVQKEDVARISERNMVFQTTGTCCFLLADSHG